MPAVAEATRIVTNRKALADEIGDYRPQDRADVGPGGVQAFYDPITGETTIFPEDIEVGEGETPLRAMARIILHERPARNLPEMISAKPLYLNTKNGRNWLRTAGLQLPGARGFQSGQANVPNEAVVVNLAKAQAPKIRPPRSHAACWPSCCQIRGCAQPHGMSLKGMCFSRVASLAGRGMGREGGLTRKQGPRFEISPHLSPKSLVGLGQI
jgi:hypothetical protein